VQHVGFGGSGRGSGGGSWLAQGEYKGAREVLARHGRTAQPWGGPGVC
jgi:hypothetical protein